MVNNTVLNVLIIQIIVIINFLTGRGYNILKPYLYVCIYLCVCLCTFSHVRHFVTPWTVCSPLGLLYPVEFSSQDYWSGCHSLQGIFLSQRTCISCVSCFGRWDSLLLSHLRVPIYLYI